MQDCCSATCTAVRHRYVSQPLLTWYEAPEAQRGWCACHQQRIAALLQHQAQQPPCKLAVREEVPALVGDPLALFSMRLCVSSRCRLNCHTHHHPLNRPQGPSKWQPSAVRVGVTATPTACGVLFQFLSCQLCTGHTIVLVTRYMCQVTGHSTGIAGAG